MIMIAAKPMFLFALVLGSVVADHPFRAARHAVEQTRLRVGRHVASLRALEAAAAATPFIPAQRDREADGSAALLQEDDMEDCAAKYEEITYLMYTSRCYYLFLEVDMENITTSDFEGAVAEMCSSCDFEGVGALIDAWPMSCPDLPEDVGEAWGVINAFCSTDLESGELCALGLADFLYLDLGEDDAVQVCEKTTCAELFFQNWVDNSLTGEVCIPMLIEATQLCVQVDGEYCVGRELAMFASKSDRVEYDHVNDLCNSECGQAFIDGIAAEYAEHEECYSEGIHSPSEIHDLYCNQTVDGAYCIVQLDALFDEFLACPEYIPSDYISEGCSPMCATELEDLANSLGCCARLAPQFIHDIPEEAQTFAAWAKTQCHVDFTKCGSGEQGGGCGECEAAIHDEIAAIRDEMLWIQYEAFDHAANRIAEAMMMHGGDN